MIAKETDKVIAAFNDCLKPDFAHLVNPARLKEHHLTDTATFWGADKKKDRLISCRYPDKEMLISMADAVCEGNLRFWQPWHMEQTHSFEKLYDPIDWQDAPNGDLEWTHALLRLYHFVDLAVAYDLTQKEKYLNTLRNHLTSFTTTRFYSEGVLSKNLLDAALRIHHLLKTIDLLKSVPDLDGDGILKCEAVIAAEAEYLCKNLRVKMGNWEFFITVGLLMASVYCKEYFDVSRWEKEGGLRFEEILDSEILPEGHLIEACPMYHGQVVLLLLDYRLMLSNNKQQVSAKLDETIDKMVQALVVTATPGKTIPRIGDSDLFDIKYITDYAELVTGKKYPMPFVNEHLSVEKIIDTGWEIARFPAGTSNGYLLFDKSGKPPVRRNWHSHGDDLQFVLHDGEREVFIDPGRFTYSSYFKKPLPFLGTNYKPVGLVGSLYHLFYPRFKELNQRDWRAYFRHTKIHNTICCDNKMQRGYTNLNEKPTVVEPLFSQATGPIWCSSAVLKDNDEWLQNNKRHEDSIRKESDSYHHTRLICSLFPHCIIVVDKVRADAPHNWKAAFHVNPELTIISQAINSYQLTTRDDKKHLLLFAGSENDSITSSVDPGWHSPVYNIKEPSSLIRARMAFGNQRTLVSAIMLGVGDVSDKYLLHTKNDDMNNVNEIIVTRDNTRISIYLSDDSGDNKSWDKVTSNGILALTVHTNTRLTAVGLIHGTQLKVGDTLFTPASENTCLYQELG